MDDRGARIDDQLSGIGKMKECTCDSQYNNQQEC